MTPELRAAIRRVRNFRDAWTAHHGTRDQVIAQVKPGSADMLTSDDLSALLAALAAVAKTCDDYAERIRNARAEIREQSVRHHTAGCGMPVDSLVEQILASIETHLVDPDYRPIHHQPLTDENEAK